MKLLAQPKEPNYVRLVWTVRSVTPTQAKYIRMYLAPRAGYSSSQA